MKQRISDLVFLTALLWSAGPALAAKKQPAVTNSTAPTTFAPMSADHALASLWNDPDFQRRLIGSYGFASDSEPRMTPEEQVVYRTKVIPLINEDPKKAIPLLEGIVKTNASAVFDYTLGNIYFQDGDLTNAVKHFETALTKFSDFKRAQKNLAFALMQAGKYDDAIKPLTRTLMLGAGDGRVLGFLGFAYMSQGRFASAAGAYEQALVYEPENIDFKMGLVKCLVSLENYDYALTLLNELIKQFPQRENLWILQANVYIQKEQPSKAAITLEMLRRLDKIAPKELYLLGDLYMSQESRDLALGAYMDAMNKDGGTNVTKVLRAAQIFVSRNAWDEARQLFGKIRGSSEKLDSADELKLLKLESKVAMQTGAGEEAIKVLEQIISRNPLDGEALLLAGDYYSRNDQKEKAEFRYDTASKLQGFEADGFVKHAQLLVQSQKYVQALDLLHKAQKVKPRDNVQRYLEKIEQMARTQRRS